MNLNEVKEEIYKVVSQYFAHAETLWLNQMEVAPERPYVTIDFRNVDRRRFTVDAEDNFNRYYHCSTLMEINLYSNGKVSSPLEGYEKVRENTALSDLLDFCSYIESYAANNELAKTDIDVYLNPPVRDLTQMDRDTGFPFHAMAEFTVNFTISANGMFGISGRKENPDSSGGGIADMEERVIEPIETVEITSPGQLKSVIGIRQLSQSQIRQIVAAVKMKKYIPVIVPESSKKEKGG